MSSTDYASEPGTPAPKPSNRTLWWVLGCAGATGLGLIVVGIVATIVVPNVYMRQQSKERIQAELHWIEAALKAHHAAHGVYPATLSELTEPGGVLAGQSVPTDPWHRPYVLERGDDPDRRPRILTLGRDGAPGGEGVDADTAW
ncbi:MAG: type II secretion system protein GspG [Planctomycetes bacterium]|nr:type II secretion system protein GspG [Planctomycetota bacterium]